MSSRDAKHWLIVILKTLLLATLLASTVLTLDFLPGGRGHDAAASETGSYEVSLPVVLRAHPKPATVFGIVSKTTPFSVGLDLVEGAGAEWIRLDLLWPSVEPNQGDRNWNAITSLQNQIADASSRGIKTIVIIRNTPSWAQAWTGIVRSPVRNDKLAAFGNFVFDLVDRLSKPPYNVEYWELWNEPDVDPDTPDYNPEDGFGCWGDEDDPYFGGRTYADMLKVAYPKIKAADPQAKVLVGGLLMNCDPATGLCPAVLSKFLEGILVNGGANYFDGVSFHAYEWFAFLQDRVGVYGSGLWNSYWNTTGPVINAKAQFLKQVLAAYGVNGKFLMNTESGLRCDSCTGYNNNFETTKAYYVAQVYSSAVHLGLQANLWYKLTGWFHTELVDGNLNPLPAYTAFQAARSIIREATSLGPISNADVSNAAGLIGYKLRRGDQELWVVWSLDGASHTVNLLRGTPAAVYDVFGNPMASSSTMTIDLAPRYIEWAP